MVSCDILQFLKKIFNQIAQGNDTYQRALYAADVYLRQHIVKGYRYDENYTFSAAGNQCANYAACAIN